MLNIEELTKLFAKAKNKDEVGAKLMGEIARKELKQFLDFFRKDYAEKIDWDKGYELLDDVLENYVSPGDLEKKDSFYLLVRAFDKIGNPFRFIIKTIVDINNGYIKAGIADVPDEDPDMEDDEEEMDEEDIMAIFTKNFVEKLKAGNLKPLDDSPNCSRCGRSDLPLTITLDASSMKTQKICSVCMNNGGAQNRPAKPKTVSELDKEIAEYEDMARTYEQLIKNNPQPDNLPQNLARYAQTPMSNYRSILAVLADLKSKRMQAMTSMEDQTRLEYELKKALEAEDYITSAALRDKLNKLKK